MTHSLSSRFTPGEIIIVLFLDCFNDLYRLITHTRQLSRITQQRCIYYNRDQLIRYSYSDNITIHCALIIT